MTLLALLFLGFSMFQYSFGLLDLRFLNFLCNFLLYIFLFLLINFLYTLFSCLRVSSVWLDSILFSRFLILIYCFLLRWQSWSNHGLFCFFGLVVLLLFVVCLEMPVSIPASMLMFASFFVISSKIPWFTLLFGSKVSRSWFASLILLKSNLD